MILIELFFNLFLYFSNFQFSVFFYLCLFKISVFDISNSFLHVVISVSKLASSFCSWVLHLHNFYFLLESFSPFYKVLYLFILFLSLLDSEMSHFFFLASEFFHHCTLEFFVIVSHIFMFLSLFPADLFSFWVTLFAWLFMIFGGLLICLSIYGCELSLPLFLFPSPP